MLYAVIAACLGLIAVLLTVIVYLMCCRSRSKYHHHTIFQSSTANSDRKYSTRNLISSASTQTSPENESLLAPDGPDQTWVLSPPRRRFHQPRVAPPRG